MSNSTVLILGGRSDIGRATAHAFAAQGHAIQLAARNAISLEPDRTDIALRYDVTVTLHEFDALDTSTHATFINALPELPEIAVCVVGMLGNQAESERSPDAAVTVIRSNFEGPASILAHLANRFVARGSGTLVGVSSVAGERGRATNYVYGSAKAGFTAFLSGLRSRLARQNIHVVTVLPGFVATQMTAGKDLPPRLTAQSEEVGSAIVEAVHKRRDVIYVRPIWFIIMTVIRVIPEKVFKRLSI